MTALRAGSGRVGTPMRVSRGHHRAAASARAKSYNGRLSRRLFLRPRDPRNRAPRRAAVPIHL
ncbi:hypothetical protein BURMUCF2_2742 [Burkholderia multivorans CF2]|nr:hypothetical protein BURMUCF2_2742 [Burkholderia multivorans CF2]